MDKQPFPVEHYYRDTEIAQILGIHRVTVWSWVKQGILPEPVKLSSGTTRWRGSELPLIQRKGVTP